MRVRHEFVDFVPKKLDEGVLYVSMRFGTVVHLCACGCGEEIVTPLGPAEWKLTYDGREITLTPSVGNWGLPCRSHYWIREGKFRWARGFSESEIAAVRYEARKRRGNYYNLPEVQMMEKSAEGKSLRTFMRSALEKMRAMGVAWWRRKE